MPRRKKTRLTDDRKRQKQTTLERHGADYYTRIGAEGHKYTPEKAKLAGLKRWHPDWFDADGNLIEGKVNEGNTQSQRDLHKTRE